MTARRHLYVLGGTGFARRLAADLEAADYAVRLSVATPLGADEVERHAAEAARLSGGLQVGRLTPEALADELRLWRAEALVDATHPYAIEVSAAAAAAAGHAGLPLLRAERPGWSPADAMARAARTTPAPASASSRRPTNSPPRSWPKAPVPSSPWAPRDSPPSPAAAWTWPPGCCPPRSRWPAALDAGVAPAELIAAYPPYTAEFTVACLRHLGCDVIVSKESGPEGGLDEKLAAAEPPGARLFVLARPVDDDRHVHPPHWHTLLDSTGGPMEQDPDPRRRRAAAWHWRRAKRARVRLHHRVVGHGRHRGPVHRGLVGRHAQVHAAGRHGGPLLRRAPAASPAWRPPRTASPPR